MRQRPETVGPVHSLSIAHRFLVHDQDDFAEPSLTTIVFVIRLDRPVGLAFMRLHAGVIDDVPELDRIRA